MTGVFSSLRPLITRLGSGRLGRNTVFSTVGLGVRAVVQAGYLLVLSHWMGAKDYGLFAGSVAAATLISPLSGWGGVSVLTRQIACDRNESRTIWAAAVLQVFASGAVLVAALMLGSCLLLTDGVSARLMLLLGISELIALPLVQVATGLCVALDCGVAAALLMCLTPLFRLLFVIAGLFGGMAGTPSHVSWLHFAGSIAGALIAYGLVTSLEGRPNWATRLRLRENIRDGSRYAIGNLVGTSYLEVDKVLLLQVLGATVTGAYTVSFRVMSVFALPVAALIGAALPRLFAQHGTLAGWRTLKMITLAGFGYALLATVAAVGISPWMPVVFGAGFGTSSHYLLLLAPWIVLYALHQAGATGLTAFARQMSRVIIESVGFVLIVVLNLALYPHMGAVGAVWSLLVAEIFMASCCWWFLRRTKFDPTSKSALVIRQRT